MHLTRQPDARNRAFVVFLMFNDSYLAGALVAAFGLIRQGSPSRRVCVVTPEITDAAKRLLAEVYDDVVVVDPVGIPDDPDLADPAQIRTGSARVSGAALTRFASLRLGPDGDLGCAYRKIVVIDADLLPIRDFEALWDLPAPAGILNERREHMAELDMDGRLVPRPESARTGKWIWHDIYDSIAPAGAAIPREVTDRVARDPNNYGVNASLVVLEPSMRTYQHFMAWAATPEIRPLLVSQWRWVDQQAATYYWSGRWTNVDPSYSMLYGYPSLDLARGLHFAGVKPWSWRKKGFQRRLQLFPDYRLWADVFLEMLETYPALRRHNGLRKIETQTRNTLGSREES